MQGLGWREAVLKGHHKGDLTGGRGDAFGYQHWAGLWFPSGEVPLGEGQGTGGFWQQKEMGD